MKVFLTVIILGTYFQLCVNGQPGIDGKAELHNMIRSLQDQNRRITAQNQRLNLVFSGIQHMCSALQMNDCTCNEDVIDEMQGNLSDNKNLRVITVKTTGGQNDVDHVNVSVTYSAPDVHSSNVMVLFENNVMWRTAGKRFSNDDGSFTLSVTLNTLEINELKMLRFDTSSEAESIRVDINILEMNTEQVNSIPEIQYDLVKMNSSFDVSSGPNTTLTVMANENIEDDLAELGRIELISTAEKDNETIMFEEYYPWSDDILINLEPSDEEGIKELTITLTNGIARNGGSLTFFLRHNLPDVALVNNIEYGLITKLMSEEKKDFIALLGPVSQPSTEYITKPKQSVTCFTVGNRSPLVALYKVGKNGNQKLLETERIYSDFMMEAIAYTPEGPGVYKCRAWDKTGKRTEKTVTLANMVQSVFKADKTGVQHNSSDHLTISCKASGFPTPLLRFSFFDEQGPEMTSTSFQITDRTKGKSSWKIMTLSRNETLTYHTIMCLSAQVDSAGNRLRYDSSKIEIYPGLHFEANLTAYYAHRTYEYTP
ncbi:hypothetical protein MAR_005570 [Mya arenaria]|uniref:Ig-like domain-containing protein n=1 Tax=Mya arenaria TaxID=6604 RepID=A0ABY7EZX1_MYAAR|nr:uncharacterized protein LOC128202906 [Mya arenaria]WAR15465.1 hypothetical protein MAR_005570 [Mya arenaria]